MPGPRTHLVVVAHAATSASASFLAIDVSGATYRLLEPRAFGATPRPDTGGTFIVVASHDGGARYAVATFVGSTRGVFLDAIGDDADRSIPLTVEPAALHLAGSTLFVGQVGSVGYVALHAAEPRLVPLVTRPEMGRKAYDLFAREGDLVFAIDDIVMPIYADTLALGEAGPRHVAGFELPGIINGTYRQATFERTSDTGGTLFAVAPYSVMDGTGQDLVALPVASARIDVAANAVLNATRSTSPPVLEEHVSRSTGLPEKLAFGDHMTAFSGLAVARSRGAPSRLLVAAGDRGLLVFPTDFGPDTRAVGVDLGAPCHDVLADGASIWALAGRELVTLERRGDAVVPIARVPLPGDYHRFLQ